MTLSATVKRLGTIMIISGPSGAGKSTLLSKLRERIPELCFSVSCTTRKPRPGEEHGVHYYFLSKEEFETRIAANEFIEHARVFDNYYGTLYSEVADRVKAGQDVFLDIDVQGAMLIKKRAMNDDLLKKCVEFVFIAPPSYAELESRLRGRGTETEEVIQKRLGEASKEMAFWPEYDYLLINECSVSGAEDLQHMLQGFRSRCQRILKLEF